MMTQLEAGAIDLVLAPPIRDVARLSKDPRFVITFHDYSGGANLVFVQAKDGAGPTTNKLFRQALNAAIDRKRWADAVLLGYGKPKTLPLAPPNPGYDSARDQALSFDLDKAKSLLQQSGVGTPPLEVIWNATAVDNATVMQIYQQDLAKIGLNGDAEADRARRFRRPDVQLQVSKPRRGRHVVWQSATGLLRRQRLLQPVQQLEQLPQ